jgi:4-hydroxy-2-oxoheptanedioate aldolase
VRENDVKATLEQDDPVFGIIAPNRDPTLAETIGWLGFDFYMIDGEHGPATSSEVENIVRACEHTGITPLARVRDVDEKLILQFMDVGVMGVMMPGIQTADDVQAFVDAVKYPPVGTRGLGPARAADYMLGPMSQKEYVYRSNEQTLVLPQIEDIQAVDNLDAMLEVDGVDGFIVGPRDLAMSMGYVDGPDHEEVQSVIEEVYDRVLGADKVLGTTAGTGEAARDLVDRGVQLCLNSAAGLLKTAGLSYLEDARADL